MRGGHGHCARQTVAEPRTGVRRTPTHPLSVVAAHAPPTSWSEWEGGVTAQQLTETPKRGSSRRGGGEIGWRYRPRQRWGGWTTAPRTGSAPRHRHNAGPSLTSPAGRIDGGSARTPPHAGVIGAPCAVNKRRRLGVSSCRPPSLPSPIGSDVGTVSASRTAMALSPEARPRCGGVLLALAAHN